MKKYLGIDIGGTTLKVGLVDESGHLSHFKQVKTAAHGDEILKTIGQLSCDYQKITPIEGIGVSAPGIVHQDGFMTTGGAIRDFYQVNLKDLIEAQTDLPVSIENDANAAIIAEKWLGNAQTYHNYIMLVLGTGVGGGIVINDQIYRGRQGMAGEFGMMKVVPTQPGQDERLATLSLNGAVVGGLLADYNNRAHDNVTDARVLYERADQGDSNAQHAFRHFYLSLSNCLNNLALAYDPEAILIGGGISANATFMKQLIARCQLDKDANSDTKPLDFAPIMAAKLQNNAGIIGAVYQLLHR
ncbi:bglK protein [Lactobacillus selangorensis]|uniref:BglK protein n=1 Tax=Lactobacillus selangorensis TaxID=81857 RepID=A0A0R2FT54_9LACO|nr:ROK family protein [Lactobacillus selangorensis]KRN28332.1 bglK protein [Lactobacillus selangorensis]KRN31834.1 bglK protein [Lactobacillus selangorensis]